MDYLHVQIYDLFAKTHFEKGGQQMKRRKRRKFPIIAILLAFLMIVGLTDIAIKNGVADVFIPLVNNTESNDNITIENVTSSPQTEDINSTEDTSSTQEEVVDNPPVIETTTPPSTTEEPSENTTTESIPSEETHPQIDQTDSNEEIPVVVPENHGGTIYLTFDDGPSAEITPYILDILAAKGVHATFFIVGYEPDSVREELVMRIYDEGHSIGLHGQSHTYSKIYTSIEALEANFLTLQDSIYNTIGIRPTIIRFPGGSSNTVSKHYCKGIMTEAQTYFPAQGFTFYDWNVDSQDAGGVDTAAGVFENVTSGLRPGRRNIILMHDSASKLHTLEALEAIIDYGFENGYEFKVITPETESMAHQVAN